MNLGTIGTIPLAWSSDLSNCPSITYALIDTDDSTTADTAVVNLDGTTAINVYTISAAKVGTYNLKVVGSVSTYASSEIAFVLEVIDCT